MSDLPHKGFYRVEWGSDIFKIRPDIGAVGDVYVNGNKITTGIYTNSGRHLFLNMNKHYSGYMHGAVLTRDVYACDIRTVTPSPQMRECYENLINKLNEQSKVPGLSRKDLNAAAQSATLEFAREVQKQGLTFLFMPDIDR